MAKCAKKLLMISKTGNGRRWQCPQGAAPSKAPPPKVDSRGRALLHELSPRGMTHLTDTRAGHPSIQALQRQGLITLEQNPAHYNYKYQAHLTPKGRRHYASTVAREDRAEEGKQRALFKARALPLRAPQRKRSPYPFEGYLEFQGVEIDIETRAGSYRRGVADDGTKWATLMRWHYGEVRGTTGADGDPVDVFVGPDPFAPFVYVIQTKFPGAKAFDETKSMLGFANRDLAVGAFRDAYDKAGFFQGVTRWTVGAWAAAMARPKVQRGTMRKVLTKAEQLRLFGGASGSQHSVKAHARRTKSGQMVMVMQHQRREGPKKAVTKKKVGQPAKRVYAVGAKPKREDDMTATTDTQSHLVTFSAAAAQLIRSAIKDTGATTKDLSVDLGLHDRGAFSATRAEWDKVHAMLSSGREGAEGSSRHVYTMALKRVPTSAQHAANQEAGAARKARRAARKGGSPKREDGMTIPTRKMKRSQLSSAQSELLNKFREAADSEGWALGVHVPSIPTNAWLLQRDLIEYEHGEQTRGSRTFPGRTRLTDKGRRILAGEVVEVIKPTQGTPITRGMLGNLVVALDYLALPEDQRASGGHPRGIPAVERLGLVSRPKDWTKPLTLSEEGRTVQQGGAVERGAKMAPPSAEARPVAGSLYVTGRARKAHHVGTTRNGRQVYIIQQKNGGKRLVIRKSTNPDHRDFGSGQGLNAAHLAGVTWREAGHMGDEAQRLHASELDWYGRKAKLDLHQADLAIAIHERRGSGPSEWVTMARPKGVRREAVTSSQLVEVYDSQKHGSHSYHRLEPLTSARATKKRATKTLALFDKHDHQTPEP